MYQSASMNQGSLKGIGKYSMKKAQWNQMHILKDALYISVNNSYGLAKANPYPPWILPKFAHPSVGRRQKSCSAD